MIRSFIICTLHPIVRWDGKEMNHVWEKGEMHVEF
jgi:hypothetical protein